MTKILFLDNIQRTILGGLITENEHTIEVQNPVVVMVNPNQNGQLTVQLLPVVFRELITENEVSFVYNRVQITISSIKNISDKLGAQYSRYVEGLKSTNPQSPQVEAKTVTL
jgi:hypothetical protein